jgi:RNA polymerase sigma-70 factor, ECF subfamily
VYLAKVCLGFGESIAVNQPSESLELGSFSRLVHGAKAGDATARSEICRQVEQHLRGMADQNLDQALRRKLNPSDIAQQAMLRMVDGFEDFRGSTSQEFYAWINSILRNEINSTRRDYRRQRRDVRREQAEPAEGIHELIASQDRPDLQIQRHEQVARFREVLTRLPQDYAEVIQLRGIDELPFAEIAQKMERSVDAVSKLWARALVKLSEELKTLDDSRLG